MGRGRERHQAHACAPHEPTPTPTPVHRPDSCYVHGLPYSHEVPYAEGLAARAEARDMDRIRSALGEPRISGWGVSYGTYTSAVYRQLFPDRVERLVLDSNEDPDPARFNRAWPAGHEQGV